ncbi:MAG TPA: OsmC family protein [Puia sp.]
MKISARIDSALNRQETVVQTNDAAKVITLPVKPSGFGSAVNGGELLLMALATCFCNDIYREAGKRGIDVRGVEVEFTGEFGGEGEPGRNFTYRAKVDSDAAPEVIEELILYTDLIAEVHNTLRRGIAVNLVN